ncbi:MAG: electron transport complex subunit RsxB [Candidimonas sp.]|jgi:electron transport complex protein RnfB
MSLIDRIDAVLPQTQCTQCGYEGCRPYATAIAMDGEAINRCPPGGQRGIAELALLLHVDAPEPDPACGEHKPLHLAVIDETHCIGCTLCIQACPVDAIVGANKLMHTVLADQCTGCELCVAPCPVDCIDMRPAGFAWTQDHADQARLRHQRRQDRLRQQHAERSTLAAKTLANKAPISAAAHNSADERRRILNDALARARARRQENEQRKTH